MTGGGGALKVPKVFVLGIGYFEILRVYCGRVSRLSGDILAVTDMVFRLVLRHLNFGKL